MPPFRLSYSWIVQTKQQLGASGEAQARWYLENHGYTLIEANYRTRFGEIDLIMRDGATLVFVEVKTRRGTRQGYPEEAVTWFKLRHTIKAAEAYCTAQKYIGNWRIDVVAVTASRIRHTKNVTGCN